jgi:hypothetical protein
MTIINSKENTTVTVRDEPFDGAGLLGVVT